MAHVVAEWRLQTGSLLDIGRDPRRVRAQLRLQRLIVAERAELIAAMVPPIGHWTRLTSFR
jgi:hypothetical protein